ncbi:MAG: 16S rRNA (cytosine(1402)-N(4))-methyltransferase RsmH [Myxococcales bacterium]|nr:16S rRNA (cytosine(1402)-N(4))-methyltransferase RsmH [Myxococcales bacterium]
MLNETLECLAPCAGRTYADATVGGGGHSAGILERSAPDGRLIGVDRDEAALSAARERLAPWGERVTLVHGPFAELRSILAGVGVPRVAGLVADLGVSSPQLDRPERGFSFRADGPLDMRMDRSGDVPTALELIESLGERELADVIYELGEERRSRPIARAIKRALERNELRTTEDLRRAVIRVTGPKRGRVDPATKTFQALRIAVNDELGQLDALLSALPDVLEDDAVAVVISFHSLEDRRVKRFFKAEPTLAPLTKKPLVADAAELEANPRARSAKLRAARRVPRDAEVRA